MEGRREGDRKKGGEEGGEEERRGGRKGGERNGGRRKGQEEGGRKEEGMAIEGRGGGRKLIVCLWAVVVLRCRCGWWSLWGVW